MRTISLEISNNGLGAVSSFARTSNSSSVSSASAIFALHYLARMDRPLRCEGGLRHSDGTHAVERKTLGGPVKAQPVEG
jgi:hypothetical protein